MLWNRVSLKKKEQKEETKLKTPKILKFLWAMASQLKQPVRLTGEKGVQNSLLTPKGDFEPDQRET